MLEAIEIFILEAQEVINANYENSRIQAPLLRIKKGRKYAKLVLFNPVSERESSVWGFVNMQNGDLLKAASWNTPAKGARGNILNGTASYGPYGPTYLR